MISKCPEHNCFLLFRLSVSEQKAAVHLIFLRARIFLGPTSPEWWQEAASSQPLHFVICTGKVSKTNKNYHVYIKGVCFFPCMKSLTCNVSASGTGWRILGLPPIWNVASACQPSQTGAWEEARKKVVHSPTMETKKLLNNLFP